jgi:hypothetical protein
MVVKEIISKLVLDSAAVPHCTFKDGLLGYKTRIWVGSVPELLNQLIAALHSSTLDGYFGFRVTNRRLKSLFYWKGMKDDVHQFVKCCQVRLQVKPDRSSNPSKLQPLLVPTEAWQIVSMDFIEGLPRSWSASCMLVVMGKFTKFSHFIALAHPYTASSVASVFMCGV